MMKKLNDNVLQFDDVDEFFNYSIKTYVDLFENEIDVNIIKSFCVMYDEIKTTHENVLHIILYDDCFCIYDNKNIAHEYFFYNNDIIFDFCVKYENFDEFLQLNDLYYIE